MFNGATCGDRGERLGGFPMAFPVTAGAASVAVVAAAGKAGGPFSPVEQETFARRVGVAGENRPEGDGLQRLTCVLKTEIVGENEAGTLGEFHFVPSLLYLRHLVPGIGWGDEPGVFVGAAAISAGQTEEPPPVFVWCGNDATVV